MDKETLSNYGWITIVTLVLAVMLALATPFGTYVGDGVVSIARGYVATSEKKLNDDNVKEMGNKWDGKFENGVASGEGSDTTEIKREAGSVIPTGAKYTPSGKTALVGNGTNKFPDAPATGDTYEEGDYKYTYNKGSRYGTEWSVKVIDNTKSEYGIIISEIANKYVTNMYSAFQGCSSITTAPTIPSGMTDISYTFSYCTSLVTSPKIPSGVTNMESTFQNCTSLTVAPVIPSTVTNIVSTFVNCKALTTAPKIPDGITDMSDTFNNCAKLTVAPIIPDSVTNLSSTFGGCTSLTTAPTIPGNVLNMVYTFYDCTSLTGTVTINSSPTKYNGCFESTTKSITLVGSSSKLTELAATANSGNITVK